MFNPFDINSDLISSDEELVKEALGGCKKSLEDLILRHQGWIYNIVLRMTFHFQNAEDITQEILIKMTTKLGTYKSDRASFRTWLYRMAVNHIIDEKRSQDSYRFPGGFVGNSRYIASIPLEEIPEGTLISPEKKLLIKEAQYGCLLAMLICFEPKERIVYILGEIFNVNSSEGAEILEITPVNFRKILSRARNQLNEFLEENCGLVNADVTCRCEGKIMHNLRTGRLDPEQLRLNLPDTPRVRELVSEKVETMNKLIQNDMKDIYQEMPFFEPKKTVELFKDILNDPAYNTLFS